MNSNKQQESPVPWERSERNAAVPSSEEQFFNLPTSRVTKHEFDPLWTPEQVAQRLNVSPDWVRDHSSRKEPRLPVIRLGGGPGKAGLLRYRPSQIEMFIDEMQRHSDRLLRRGI